MRAATINNKEAITVRRSISLFLSLFALPVTACAADANAAQGNAAQTIAAPAPAASMDIVPIFVGACMNPGPDADKIREALLKAGGVQAADQSGKASSDPTRLSAFVFRNAQGAFSVMFNRAGACSVFTQFANLDTSKASLARFYAGAASVFDVSAGKDTDLAEGETIISSQVLTSKRNGSRLAIKLSQVTRKNHETATIMSRRILPK
jgi:hypothetical protein